MKKKRRIHPLRLLSLIVIAYLLMAFSWWSVLLFTKNRDAFAAKRDLIRIGMIAEGVVQTEADFLKTKVYQDLQRQYRNQEWMILGEASVFVLSLVAGIWFINRGYQKEVDAVNSRRNFLLSITHELKSPLASIRLVMETLLKRNLERSQVEKLSSSALRETERLNGLVDNLLLSARLDTAYQPARDAVNLPELLTDLIHKLREKYPKVTFNLAIPHELPIWYGDRAGFTSVALNLLENAVKYSPDPAHITTTLNYQEQPAGFLFYIADQGHGIPDREKRRIFEKFYRIGSEDTRQTKGTGLGLYIVEQIIKAHNGKIKIADNTPKGSVFQVFLPDL